MSQKLVRLVAMPICLFIYLFIYLSIYLSIYHFILVNMLSTIQGSFFFEILTTSCYQIVLMPFSIKNLPK